MMFLLFSKVFRVKRTTLFQSVTHPFTFLATKKGKSSRQMDDAENEQYMNRVFIFVAESLTLKPTRPMG